MLARTITAQPSALGGTLITVEVDVTTLEKGVPEFSLVGLAGKAIDEAKARITGALKNSSLPHPKNPTQRIMVSLAPADIKKDGPLFDLPIAIAYLIGREVLSGDFSDTLFIGELSLDGSIREVSGVLPAVYAAKKAGLKRVIVPQKNIHEAALVDGIAIYGAHTIDEIVRQLKDQTTRILTVPELKEDSDTYLDTLITLEDIRGQESAKRGLIIAAAGRHNAILVGPPGTGKTLLARALPGILPSLSHDELLEVTSIHSFAGSGRELSPIPPFRTPHHSSSHTALVGGGTIPRPGEVTLAHRGVLFLDEFPEFDRRSIDSLRQPLEDRIVTISRVNMTQQFPANFMLVAAMNPSRGDTLAENYSEQMLETYKNKISGPILDRIDLWLPVPHIPYETLTKINTQKGETERARETIKKARMRQKERFKDVPIGVNGEMTTRNIDNLIPLHSTVRTLLKESATQLNLSPRSYHRLIKTARTIADLAGTEDIEESHILEALQYRIPKT